MKRIIFDLDNTLCTTVNGNYSESTPDMEVIRRLRQFKNDGFEIIISTSRQIITHQNNIGKINVHTLPVIIEWLNRYDVPYDEIYVGKPWCGEDGFYVDDRAIRPSEFVQMDYQQIRALLGIPA